MEQRAKILVVDDERASRELLGRVSEHFGFEAVKAEDGEEGWALYQKTQPDLTISDIYMPKMNGLQLLASIKKRDEMAKVILITGYFRFRAMIETCSFLPDGFLQKPFDIEELGRLICSLLGEPQAGKETQEKDRPTPEHDPQEVAPERPLSVEEPEHDG
jgi:YesN/AraC family two-component response regulator